MNKKLIQSIAKLAKVQDVEAFTKALESEQDTDFDLGLDNLVVRTKDEDSQIKQNIIDEVKPQHWKEATEIQIKNMRKDLGLEFEGKTPENFISAFKAKILEEAKVEPNQKITELESSLESLRGKLGEKDTEIEGLKNSFSTTERNYKALSIIPELKGLTKEEALILYNSTHEIKEDGIYRNGEKLKDNMEKAISYEDSLKAFVEEKGWNNPEPPTGRGGGAQGGGNDTTLPTNMEEFESYIKEKGYNVGSQEANAILYDMEASKTE